jgi:Cytochrome c3
MSNKLGTGVAVSLVLIVVGLGVIIGGTVWLKGRVQTTEYCSNCHVIAPYYNSWKSSSFLANTHAQNNVVCQDCHTRTVRTGLTELVRNVMHSYEVPLKEHRVRPEDCLRCHVSYAYLANRTKNLKGPDGFPLGRNPHDSHWGQLDCGICHKMHRASVDLCAGCHGFPAIGPTWATSSLLTAASTNQLSMK